MWANMIPIDGGNYFGLFDYIVFGAMLGISCVIGLYFGCYKSSRPTTEEYLMGNRKMKAIPIGISLFASQLSAITITVIPVEVYLYGPDIAILAIGIIFVTILINYVILPVFYNNNLDNCYAYLELRFGKEVKLILTLLFILTTVLNLPVFLIIPSMAFSQVTGINIHIINAFSCGICSFYTLLGGIKAVVWVDVFQAAVMLLSMVTVAILGIYNVGGLSEVIKRSIDGHRLTEFTTSLDLTTRNSVWNVFFSAFIGWTAYVIFNQSCVQRIRAVRSLSHARTAINVFGIGFFVISTWTCFTGLIIYAYFHGCDPIQLKIVDKPDKLVSYFIARIVGHIPGLTGLFISCLFSASLSTISTNLNTLAGVIYQDFIKPLHFFIHNELKANIIMKIIIICLGVYCCAMGLIVEKFASLFQLMVTFKALSHGAIFGVFTFGMLYPWANKKSVLWGALLSTIVVLWIFINSYILLYQGKFINKTLPTQIDQCNIGNNYPNTTTFIDNEMTSINDNNNNNYYNRADHNNQNSSRHLIMMDRINNLTDGNQNETFSIYKISFQWYVFIGASLVWLIGIPLSHLIGSNDIQNLNPDLLSPVIKNFVCNKMIRDNGNPEVLNGNYVKNQHNNRRRRPRDPSANELNGNNTEECVRLNKLDL